jgi:hypothetical protein
VSLADSARLELTVLPSTVTSTRSLVTITTPPHLSFGQ